MDATSELPPILRDLPEELIGPRIVVRPYRSGDGAAVWEALDESRDYMRPWLYFVDQVRSPADSEAFARKANARWMLREDMVVGLWHRETGRYLGSSGIHVRDWAVPAFEIGYWIRRSEQGHGYMTEAVVLLLALAFDTLAAQRVEIRCDARNTRSAAIPQRLGFVQEAALRHDTRDLSGELRDTLIFALTSEDYARTIKAPAIGKKS